MITSTSRPHTTDFHHWVWIKMGCPTKVNFGSPPQTTSILFLFFIWWRTKGHCGLNRVSSHTHLTSKIDDWNDLRFLRQLGTKVLLSSLEVSLSAREVTCTREKLSGKLRDKKNSTHEFQWITNLCQSKWFWWISIGFTSFLGPFAFILPKAEQAPPATAGSFTTCWSWHLENPRMNRCAWGSFQLLCTKSSKKLMTGN